MFGQKKLAAVMAEFLGTGLLTLALYAVLARISLSFFTASAVGLTFALLVMIFGRISGGHFNPAVTLAHWTRNNVSTIHAAASIVAQFLGAIAAWGLIAYLLNQKLTNLAGPHFAWSVFVAEAVGTAIFTFGIAAAIYMEFEGSKFAATVGLSLFLGILVASLASNGIVNPAVALGVQSWDWAYATGPIVGGIIGMNAYYLLFAADWTKIGKTSKKKKSRARK